MKKLWNLETTVSLQALLTCGFELFKAPKGLQVQGLHLALRHQTVFPSVVAPFPLQTPITVSIWSFFISVTLDVVQSWGHVAIHIVK